MSVYGEILRQTGTAIPGKLRARSYLLPRNSSEFAAQKSLTVLPIDAGRKTRQEDHIYEAVLIYLSGLFDSIIEEGRTYPQETKLGFEGFKKYFCSHAFFIGIIDADPPQGLVSEPHATHSAPPVPSQDSASSKITEGLDREETMTLTDLIAGRDLPSCLAGMFYIKPNYPGRSSHCCNGGFVVDPRHRGQKIGKTLALSYIHYAPLLGYRASVFNLVYTNNLASMAIWDSLGFKRVGLIPEAGRLKVAQSPDGKTKDDGNEWVDAIVYWKKFSE